MLSRFQSARVLFVVVMCGLVFAQFADAFAQSDNKRPGGTVKPRDVGSKNFLLHTDLNDADAKELLERLETMLTLISKYWARPNRQVIECFVVKDRKNWNPNVMDPAGWAKIQSGAGLTITQKVSQGAAFRAKSVVYAIADRGTPQHEAVHAYCGQTFGRTGPVWYAEGMAEMGQYWRQGEKSVHIHKHVLNYLQKSAPKSLNEIVNSNERTGDSWQNYAWRWALCHLLATNPNYATRFRPLGLSLLTQGRSTFENTYGSMAKEISFEYLFFLNHLDNGIRADLISWDWKAKFRFPRSSGSTILASIGAKGGWQASRANVKKGTEYEYSASGLWRFQTDGELIDADGIENSKGRLVGVILKNDDEYQLSKPFELGTHGSFTPPESGKLYLRCNQPWNEINDEDTGRVTFKLKLKNAGKPLPKPEKTRSNKSEQN